MVKRVKEFNEWLESMSLSSLLWINTLSEWKAKGENEDTIDGLVSLLKKLRTHLPDHDHETPDPNSLWKLHDQEMTDLHKQIHRLPNRDWFHHKIRLIDELQRRIREQT